MIVRLVAVTLMAVGVAFAAPARAQTDDDIRVMNELENDHPDLPTACGDGLVSSEATDGHCCWPGQAWSEERGRCAGTPTCPSGWEVRGSLCVRGEFVKELGAPPPTQAKPAPVVVTPRPASPPPTPIEASPRDVAPAPVERPKSTPIDLGTRPRSYDPEVYRRTTRNRDEIPYNGGEVPAGWRVDSRPRKGLIIPGSIILGISYTVSVLSSLGQMAGSEGKCVQDTAPIGLIPVVGPLAQGLAYSGSGCAGFGSRTSSLLPFGVLASGHQIVGLIMIIVGAKNPNQFLVPDTTASNQPKWDVYAGTQGTNQGLTLAGRF